MQTTDFGTSRPSTSFFTVRLTHCPHIGTERPGSLTSRTTISWTAYFTTRVRFLGCVRHLALPRRCSSNSPRRQAWLSIGRVPNLSSLGVGGSGEPRWHHYELQY